MAETRAPGQRPPTTYSLAEVAQLLHTGPETVLRLGRRFGAHLSPGTTSTVPTYTEQDVSVLATAQRLLADGYNDEQVTLRLPGRGQAAPSRQTAVDGAAAVSPVLPDGPTPAPDATTLVRMSDGGQALARLVGDTLSNLAGSQQIILNGQSALREMVGVVVQDNFNLQDENRKLRERMLELERALAEYQRREETRKDRSESRIRALEATVAALQQQVAQLVQIQRQQQQRRNWFG
jgi:hypothetical protein